MRDDVPDSSKPILIVDDNHFNSDMLSRRLSSRGFAVQVADDGYKALEMMRAEDFGAVLLDVVMPGISGLEVLSKLRETYTLVELPIIITTVKDSSVDMMEGLKLGANDYVFKPINFDILIARLQTHLSVGRLHAERQQFLDMRSDFLSLASHDLKSPLGHIMGWADLIRNQVKIGRPVDETSVTRLGLISRACENMLHIIEDFIDMRAIEQDGLQLEKKAVDFSRLAKSVAIEHGDSARQKGIDIVHEFDENLGLVAVDERRIGQVMRNLIDNAIKFGDSGQSVVTRTKETNGAVVFEVEDNGPGLSDDDLKICFEKGRRLSNRPTGHESSSGLGLVISRLLVEAHQGEMGVFNNPETGCTFWFRIPCR